MEYNFDKIIKIDNQEIGSSKPCYIIAEIGVNHNGKLSLAKKLIDAAIESGSNAVKFQKRSLPDLYRKEALDNPNIESQGFEILLGELKELELTKNDYEEIVEHCKEKEITMKYSHHDPPKVWGLAPLYQIILFKNKFDH